MSMLRGSRLEHLIMPQPKAAGEEVAKAFEERASSSEFGEVAFCAYTFGELLRTMEENCQENWLQGVL